MSVKAMAFSEKASVVESAPDSASENVKWQDQTHRKLKLRHIELIGIGGAIGTTLFVQIGTYLTRGGPASLFIAFALWSTLVVAINNCLSEMVTWIPISAPFTRFADHFVDPALGFAAGVNYFLLQTILVPFEITALNIVLRFWTDKIPVTAVIAVTLIAYTILNCFAVRYYGECEFWLALGKIILIVGLIAFTLITMVGGNPLHDVYGFRYWNPSQVQGAPFAEYISTGFLGQIMGFFACLVGAATTFGGSDHVALTAGEAEMPRSTMPKAFRTVFYRLLVFYVLGSLCVGIVVPYSDPILLSAVSHAQPGAASSPYVIAMERMGIPVLPHIVNALIMTSIFSAGNSFFYSSTRTLYGLALERKAPRFLLTCTSTGIPIASVGLTLGISCLAFLQMSSNSAIVFQWLVNVLTTSGSLNLVIISLTYIRFYNALKIQGISRNSLPYKTLWQPFCGYYGLCVSSVMAIINGYTVFLPGHWDTPTFLFSYTMIGVSPLLFISWKVFHRTQWRRLKDITFFDAERRKIDEYEQDQRQIA